MPIYILWALFTPLLILLARKFDFQKNVRLRNVLIHLAFSLIIGFTHKFSSIFSTFGIRAIDDNLGRPLLEALFAARFAIIGGTIDSLFTYWIIILSLLGWDYYNKYRTNELRASKLEAKLALAELDALKMQLHPHFLFNTLHSISTLMQRDVEAADRMLSRLSDLLRISLDNVGKNKITLREELDFLNKYLDIQAIRFKGRLNINMRINDTALDLKVPNLILQPLVENSIKHGVEHMNDESEILISAGIENGNLNITVKDSGPGIDGNYTEGVGLKNTKARLEQLYGVNFIFSISNADSKGVLVNLKIPAEE